MKFTMPKFSGGPNPEDYLSWALKVDKIYRVHNYDEAKKVAMASLEFEDYALNWWEQVQDLRVEQGLPQVCTWEEMKQVMRLRFVPQHYTRDLYQRLQTLKQGYKTVEEYYKEMELAMIRANVKESEEQTMARFLNGLNYQVKKITNFQPYKTIQELVHQATKAERQVQEDAKYSKFMSSNTKRLSSPKRPNPKWRTIKHKTTGSFFYSQLLINTKLQTKRVTQLLSPKRYQDKLYSMLHVQGPWA